MSPGLRGTSQRLSQLHDVALLDLDGVVYVGPDAVPGAPAALRAARADGMRLAFVTNNAARPPSAVASHLCELDVAAEPAEVITSAQAAAHYLADRLDAGASVLVLGTTGLTEALRERGLSPVSTAAESVAAVVQGYSPEMNWQLLAEGAVAINRGVLWVATNVDPTVPSPRGPLPGNGSLVAALRLATGAQPVVTGKPDPTMHHETLLRTGATRPIVVGDRLDTDIEGANAVGCASLLVLSGGDDTGGPARRAASTTTDLSGARRRRPARSASGRTARRRRGDVPGLASHPNGRWGPGAGAFRPSGRRAGATKRRRRRADRLRSRCAARAVRCSVERDRARRRAFGRV